MRRLLIAAFSIGWMLPMWVAGSMVLTFLDGEVWPLLRGEHPVNSFPFLQAADFAFNIGTVWLAAVMGWWAWQLTRHLDATPGSVEPRSPADTR